MSRAARGFAVLSAAMLYILIFVSLSSGGILLKTGFEDDEVGEIPQEPADTWQASDGGYAVDNSIVKEGAKSLGVLGGEGNQALAAFINTQSQVITVEFWLYVDGAERSLTVFLQDPNSGLTDWGAAGPYVNWIGGIVRHYPGVWEEIGPFSSDEWHYVRLVVNTGKSSFDFYVGDTETEAHTADPLGKDLGFRSGIAGPIGKISFGTYDTVTPAYVDNLLVYEGDTPPEGLFAVDPDSSLLSTWGELKK